MYRTYNFQATFASLSNPTFDDVFRLLARLKLADLKYTLYQSVPISSFLSFSLIPYTLCGPHLLWNAHRPFKGVRI